jgi:hypothetical protein
MQERIQRTKVRRIDECAREQEMRDHDELIVNARRASKHAQRTIEHTQDLLAFVDWVLESV